MNVAGEALYIDPETNVSYTIDPFTGNRIFRGLPTNQISVVNTLEPQTAEARLTGGVGGIGGEPGAPLCEIYNYHIGPPQVVKTNDPLVGTSGFSLNQIFGSQPQAYSDFKNLNGKQCVLIAPLYRCCWVRQIGGKLISNGATQIGWSLLAYGQSLISYEECDLPNGQKGKKPVVIQYFSADEIQAGASRTVEGPNNPTKAVSVSFPISANQRGTPSDGGGNIWGNCYGDYKTGYFGDWFNENLFETFGFQDLQKYRTIGEYPLTDPTNSPVSGLGWIIEGEECRVKGECIPPPPGPPGPPPPPKDPVCAREIIVDNLQKYATWAKDGTTYNINGLFITGYNPPRFELGEEYVESRQSGVPINECEIGDLVTYRRKQFLRYPKFIVCVAEDGTVISRKPLGNDRFFGETNYFTDYSQPYDQGPTEVRPDNSNKRFNVNSTCCEDTLRGLPKPGVLIKSIPNTSQFVLVDSCGCEEIEIADLGCYYSGQLQKVLVKADVKNPRTHTGVRRQVVDERCKSDGPDVYHPFDRKRDIILNRTKSGTNGLFDGDDNMECYFTSSTKPRTSNSYYYEVTDCESCGKIPYFAVAYGHISGSGSVVISDEESNKTASDSIYSQYQLICMEPVRDINGSSLPKFSFVSASTSVESNDIYVINFNRNGVKDKLDAGNFQINLAYLDGNSYANNVFTGSNVAVGGTEILQLIDNSDDFDQFETCDGEPLTSYSIISGSLVDGKYEDASVNTYGTVYPHLGIVVLHPKRLNELMGFNTVTGSNVAGDNAYKLFTSISGAAAPYSTRSGSYYLTARNVKYKTTSHYFVRAYAPYSNYSNNPTYVTGSLNEIFDKCFIKDPTTYITSVGLYNSSKELVAIAKLSKPIKKNFETDLLIKIRLNW